MVSPLQENFQGFYFPHAFKTIGNSQQHICDNITRESAKRDGIVINIEKEALFLRFDEAFLQQIGNALDVIQSKLPDSGV